MGRPTFTIDRQRLQDLRKEAGKTQLTVAKELHAMLEKKRNSEDETLKSDYQRIERNGRTSRQSAEALAKIFDVAVEVLQGKGAPEPFDYLAGIASLLRKQFASGANEALFRALEQSADTREPSDQSIILLAEDVGARIEAAQLGRNPYELEDLTKLTGLAESELLKPANVHGHWLLIANGPGIHSTEFIRGTFEISSYIREIVGDRLDSRGSDGSIRMFRDEPWFRLEIRRSNHKYDIIRIDFVRCDPSDGTGVRWARATWRERFVFEDSLRSWAYSAANFVTDFEGQHSPSGNVRRLRLLVTEHDSQPWRATGRMVISGNLDEITDQTMNGFRRENSTHSLVLNWLTVDLKCSLAPFLAEHPVKCWSVSHGARVAIDLDEHKARKRPLLDCHYGMKYRIDLVEEIGENEFAPVPWRNIDVELLSEAIKKMLDNPDDRSWTSDEPRRTFEPYVTEE